ncbi:MAG: IS6 family transposase [Chlorobiaceae bacterium]|nr:IS6 family transposase [Chlorobiaceae bacterium]
MNFKGSHFPKAVILMSMRWYIAYPLSYRNVEELLSERGLSVDHATVNRWVVKHSPTLESKFRNTKNVVGKSCKMDETYIKVKGRWVYYYRAVDKEGQTIDFFLSKTRDSKAALSFFQKAITSSGVPSKVNMDKSGANLAGLQHVNRELPDTEQIVIRQVKYLNNMIEQDHRGIKRITGPMLGFKNFMYAEATLVGIELYHMLRKGQNKFKGSLAAWQQFYALAA